jgi:phenylalanyl-tRNA synthetase alpha chain
MLEKIEIVKKEFEEFISNVKDQNSLEELRLKFLVKKGAITQLLEALKDVPAEQKPIVGKELNILRKYAESTYNELKERFDSQNDSPKIDITLAGRHNHYGNLHPVRQIFNEMVDIFVFMGFEVAEGPQIEDE